MKLLTILYPIIINKDMFYYKKLAIQNFKKMKKIYNKLKYYFFYIKIPKVLNKNKKILYTDLKYFFYLNVFFNLYKNNNFNKDIILLDTDILLNKEFFILVQKKKLMISLDFDYENEFFVHGGAVYINRLKSLNMNIYNSEIYKKSLSNEKIYNERLKKQFLIDEFFLSHILFRYFYDYSPNEKIMNLNKIIKFI